VADTASSGEDEAVEASGELLDDERLIDDREMARQLRVALRTVQRRCRQGKLPATKIGRRWYMTTAQWRRLFPDPPQRAGSRHTRSHKQS
jgi:excisionase family DNA binding protein